MRTRYRAVPDTIPLARRAVQAYATEAGLPGERLDALRLAVTEAVTNAVLHAYLDAPEPGAVDVACTRVNGSLEVVCRDHGRGMRPRIDSPGLGLGVSLMESSSDELRIEEPAGGGTQVKLVYRLG